MKKIPFLRRILYQLFIGLSLLSLTQCASEKNDAGDDHKFEKPLEAKAEPIPPPPPINYHLIATKDSSDWLRSLQPGDTLQAILVVNRVDKNNFLRLDTLVIPDSIGIGMQLYSPFPKQVDELNTVDKILFISNYAQAFAVYENGKLIKWGPVNLGKQSSPTPTGLFATNWKAKRTTSTVNSAWILDWYFNIANFDGVSLHEYALPGYPASHACIRLYREDAKWLYYWADQWTIKDHMVSVFGTPVVIFGEYPFGERKPWLLQAENNVALEITPSVLMKETQDFLPTIIERQVKRDSLNFEVAVDAI